MISAIGLWILAILYVEAVTEILVNSELLVDVRNWIHEFGGYASKLVSCGYCVSVWAAASIAWAMPTGLDIIVVDIIIATFALHRLSNIFHEFAVRWLNRIPWTMQMNQIQHVVVPGMETDDE